MLILGIDPGTATTGYGFLRVEDGVYEAVDWGLIETSKDNHPAKRLHNIHIQMKQLLNDMMPDVIVIERLFFARNAKTAMKVSQSVGVMLFTTHETEAEVFEYAPMTIKKVISGNGRADKKEMQKSLRKVLGAKVRSKARKKTHFDNAADALAVALCHAYTINGYKKE